LSGILNLPNQITVGDAFDVKNQVGDTVHGAAGLGVGTSQFKFEIIV
jgi:hypothetical protein